MLSRFSQAAPHLRMSCMRGSADRRVLFDASAREAGGHLFYWESVEQFADVAGQILALGFEEIGVYYPIDSQREVFERVASEVLPVLRNT